MEVGVMCDHPWHANKNQQHHEHHEAPHADRHVVAHADARDPFLRAPINASASWLPAVRAVDTNRCHVGTVPRLAPSMKRKLKQWSHCGAEWPIRSDERKDTINSTAATVRGPARTNACRSPDVPKVLRESVKLAASGFEMLCCLELSLS
jgi:hypothetical protein